MDRKNNDLISVIIPVYNAEQYLAETLASLMKQTYTNFEAIIINDGSSDNSENIISECVKCDNRFTVISQKNSGVSVARNIGIDNSNGVWIYFLDSDDIMESTMLEDMVEVSMGVDMVVSSIMVEDISEKCAQAKKFETSTLVNRNDIGDFLCRMDMHEKDMLLNYVWNRLMKKSVILKHNIRFNEKVRLGEDFLFICRYLEECNSILLLDKCLYHYFIRGNTSLAGRFNSNEHFRRLMMRDALKSLLNKYDIYDKAYDVFAKNEGRYSIYGIEKINLDSCSLVGTKACCDYIEEFLNREDCEYMVYYLRSAAGKERIIWRMLIRLRKPYFIYAYLKVRKQLLGK